MKKLLLALALAPLALPSLAHATTRCAGETYGVPTIVTVQINSQAPLGTVTGGTVTMEPKGGPARTYEIKASEVSQFFESADGQDEEHVIVGLQAFVAGEDPIFFRFAGPNTTGDLTAALRDPARKQRDDSMKQSGRNSLRVWKGPGYGSDQQHSFKDVVCSVTDEA